MRKQFVWFGMLAPIVYLVTVMLGGLLRSDYSHAANAISELTVAGSPNKGLMDAMFSVYNLFTLLFGLFAWLHYRDSWPRAARSVMGLLSAIGLLGLLMYFFPQDSRTAAATLRGTMHLILAGLMSLATILSAFLGGAGFRRIKGLEKLAAYSTVNGILVFLSGGVTAAGTGMGSPYLGVFERITIGLFIVWLFVVALTMQRLKESAA